MEYSRFTKDEIQNARNALVLTEHPVFDLAVKRLLNKHAEIEEELLTDNQLEVREINNKIIHRARMRKSILDIVNELQLMIDYVNEDDESETDNVI